MANKRKAVTTPLREEREKRGWTLDFLHACLCALIDDPQKAPISIRQIESWERGEHFPHPYWRHKLCTVYQKSAIELGLVRSSSVPGNEHIPGDTLSIQKKYLQRLTELYGTIKLPIGPAQGFSLQAVFQPLKLCQASFENDGELFQNSSPVQDETLFDARGLGQVQPEQPQPREEAALIVENGDEVLRNSPSRRIVILGGPGTGKSTLLKYFVGNRAQEALKDSYAPLPIFIALPELGRSGKTFKGFLLETLQNLLIDDAFVEVLWQKIQQGKAIVCLDSLDEVTTSRTDIIHKINAFLASVHPQTTCIISTRFTDFKRGQFFSSHVMEWELLPLDHALGQKLAQRLLPELCRRMQQTSAGDPKTFLRTLEMHPRIAAWGKNPLLFSLAAILYVRHGTLPESRRELYLLVVDAIIELREPVLEWRVTLRDIFGALAYKLFTEQKGRIFSVVDLIFLLRTIRQEQGENWQIEDVARRLRNAGLLEATNRGNFSFLHQTFQEYLAGYHVASLPSPCAEREIDFLVIHIDDPFYRQIIIELAYIVHLTKKNLEDYLYKTVIQQYQNAKMGLLEAQRSGQPPLSSALSGGCDGVLQALVDLWGSRLCSTLEAGSPIRREDGELASSVAWVFERNPRVFAVNALIAGLSLYKKRARFIGALGEIGTKEAQEALYRFTVEQLSNPADLPLFQYLASALGRAQVKQSIPLLQAMRDDEKFDADTRFEAHQALLHMGQTSIFDEESYYQIERILRTLRVEDDQHRPSDWKKIATIARWLETNYERMATLHAHYGPLLQALKEIARAHAIDTARLAAARTLGVVGDDSIFLFLLQRLENHTEPVYDVAHFILRSLERLAQRQQVNTTDDRLSTAFTRIEQNYPALLEQIAQTRINIQFSINRTNESMQNS